MKRSRKDNDNSKRPPEPRASATSAPKVVADRTSSFPTKLHDLLTHAEANNMQHIVAWHKDGQAFRIHIIQEFVKLLPQFFRHTKYKSFQRQLNHYGFERIWEGSEKGCYKHQFFSRDNRGMTMQMYPLRGINKPRPLKPAPQSNVAASIAKPSEQVVISRPGKRKRGGSEKNRPRPVPLHLLPNMDFSDTLQEELEKYRLYATLHRSASESSSDGSNESFLFFLEDYEALANMDYPPDDNDFDDRGGGFEGSPDAKPSAVG